jgi:hypothetical protein
VGLWIYDGGPGIVSGESMKVFVICVACAFDGGRQGCFLFWVNSKEWSSAPRYFL